MRFRPESDDNWSVLDSSSMDPETGSMSCSGSREDEVTAGGSTVVEGDIFQMEHGGGGIRDPKHGDYRKKAQHDSSQCRWVRRLRACHAVAPTTVMTA